MPALGFVFRIHKVSETSKGTPQYIFTGDKGFRQLYAMPLLCFVQQNFCSMAEKKENFAKFQTKVSWNCSRGHVKVWHPCENFYPGGRCFFYSLSKHVDGKNLPFLETFSQMVLPDRHNPALSNPQKSNWASGQVFFGYISEFENN